MKDLYVLLLCTYVVCTSNNMSPGSILPSAATAPLEGGREGGREKGREKGREREREGGREGGRERGKERVYQLLIACACSLFEEFYVHTYMHIMCL